jgi:transcriptional regulator with XRE-family HTH domain
MGYASPPHEASAFAERLRSAIKGVGIRPSPTLIANEFNLRYWGRSITPNTVRNWLLGRSMPTQDKLRVLADWLNVSPDSLRYGAQEQRQHATDNGVPPLAMQDREMLQRYLSLTTLDKKLVCDMVAALVIAASVRSRG